MHPRRAPSAADAASSDHPTTHTQRLYLEDARRKTALANVTAHVAGGFLLDKTVFHAPDARYHHAQPCDRGHIIADGHKLKIHKVAWVYERSSETTTRPAGRVGDKSRLVHRTHGPLPGIESKAQLHLDADRRDQQARAHTLMHILIAALAEARAELLAPAEVVGGGEVKLAAKLRESPASALPKIESRARQLVASRATVETLWMPRDEAAKRATPQGIAFDAIAPAEPTLRIARIGEASILPCDAPLVERTSDVGEWRFAPPMPGREGVRLRARVS